MFTTCDIVQLIYGYGPHPTDPNILAEIGEPVLFMQYQTGGKAEVMRPDAHIVLCSATQLRLCVSVHDAEYIAIRDLLFSPQQMAA